MAVKLDQPAPDFVGLATSGSTIKLSDFQGKNVVLYFYPKDNTPGCTTEGCDFRDYFEQFKQQHTLILGISRDSLRSHENFKGRYVFPFELIADEDEKVCKLYEVIKIKNMYGKKVRGIVRSTFLIDKNGILRKEWRNVKTAGHVKEVLKAVQELN